MRSPPNPNPTSLDGSFSRNIRRLACCVRRLNKFESGHLVARGRFELPSMGLFLVWKSKAHHWPGHCFRPLLVHYTTGLQETRVFGQDPISLLRHLTGNFDLLLAMGRNVADKMKKEGRGEVVGLLCYGTISIQYGIWSVTVPPVNTMSP